MERYAQILKDPRNGAKMVKVEIARSFPPSDNCLLFQLSESKNKLEFLLERTLMEPSPASEEVLACVASSYATVQALKWMFLCACVFD